MLSVPGSQSSRACGAAWVLAGQQGRLQAVLELNRPAPPAPPPALQVDACLVATGRAPYTNGLNLGSLGVATDRRGFVPVNDKMEVGWGCRGVDAPSSFVPTRPALALWPTVRPCCS